MKKITWLLLFLFVFLLSYTIRYKIESNQNITVKSLQNQFDSLADDVIFSQQEVKRAIMEFTETGRTSIHDYPSLGIKVFSDDPYSQSFKTNNQFIVKNGNMLIDPFLPTQYIEVIAKNPNENMKDIYEKSYLKQFGTGCKISILGKGNSSYFTGTSASNIDTYMPSCYVGKIPNERYIRFWYNKNKPDRYYVVNLGVGCGGGMCNVFNQIELY